MLSSSLRSPLLLTVASAAVVFFACGGQQFVAGSGDGGTGTSSGNSSGASSGTSSGASSGSSSGSGAPDCGVTVPPDAGTEADFCALEAELFTRCSECSACYQADLNECAALGDSLSAAFKSALGACASEVLCGDYSTYGTNPCVAGALTGSTKSDAQIQAAAAYCEKCEPTNIASCETEYFEPPQPDGGSSGPGYLVLLGNDATASAIQTACTPSATVSLSCSAVTVAGYEVCAATQFCKAEPQQACSTGGACSK
jgi:hypothetical protein